MKGTHMISTMHRRHTATRASHIPLRANGEVLTLADLPPSNKLIRWTPYRKVDVVVAIAAGFLTVEDALARYKLSADELASWREALQKTGPDGLRVTHLQDYRQKGGAVIG
jgi:hypothetical protein